MRERMYSTQRPEAVMYMPLPDGLADVWLRQSIAAAEDGYTADEAYMRTDATAEAIAADFDQWFARAAAWQPQTASTVPDEGADLRRLRADVDYIAMMAGVELDGEEADADE